MMVHVLLIGMEMLRDDRAGDVQTGWSSGDNNEPLKACCISCCPSPPPPGTLLPWRGHHHWFAGGSNCGAWEITHCILIFPPRTHPPWQSCHCCLCARGINRPPAHWQMTGACVIAPIIVIVIIVVIVVEQGRGSTMPPLLDLEMFLILLVIVLLHLHVLLPRKSRWFHIGLLVVSTAPWQPKYC